MSRIERISIQNFKSISDLEMDFKGCSAIVTGANNSGKTSFLKGIVDRIRFIRPEIPVKKGEKEGRGELVLDNGEKFVWEFDTAKKDKLTYITDQGRKSVTKEFGEQFFKPLFDIDKFLQSSPKQQVKQLQAIVGISFDEIDKRYEEAYNIRTERNREAEKYHAKLEKMMRVDPVKSVDLTDLKAKKEAERNRMNALYLENKGKNEKARKAWEENKKDIDLECEVHNDFQHKVSEVFRQCEGALSILKAAGFTGGDDFIESMKARVKPDKVAIYPKEPTYVEEMPDRAELDKIDALIETAAEINAQAQKYQEYISYKEQTEAAKDAAEEADGIVINIEAEKKRMIASAKFPEGITIDFEGIKVNDFPLDRNQLSASLLYISALKIAALNLGEVKSLYFDCSLLDRNSLAEITEWAESQNLQLLLEMVDRDGNEIEYQIIE